MANFKAKLIAAVLSVLSPRKLKPTDADRRRLEFKTSTKKIGVADTEKIRNTFRRRWIKKH